MVQDADTSEFPTEILAGDTYKLDKDITLTSSQQIKNLAGTLDGQGHTITLSGSALAVNVSGTIQNLGVAGSSTLILSDGQGSVANTVTGTIQNCYSTASSQAASDYMDTIGGFVGSLQGTVANCYFAGNTDMFGGGIALPTVVRIRSAMRCGLPECLQLVWEEQITFPKTARKR